MKGPIRWYGGKGNMVKTLLKYVPTHKTYVEVFGGGASLLFAKIPSKIEVYNDINSGLVNLFRVIRDPDKFKEMHRRAYLTPYSREEHKWAVEHCDDGNDVDRAYAWYIMARQCFAGNIRTWGLNVSTSDSFAKNINTYLNSLKRLPQIHQRLFLVQIENNDFRRILKTYDSKNTFFYVDPPYVLSTRKGGKAYDHEMTDKDHQELIDLLLDVKGKVMLSGYENDIYKRLDNKWNRIVHEAYCTSSAPKQTGNKRQARTEIIWMNYKLENPLGV